MKCYNFYLYKDDDYLLDETQLDEDNIEFALYLFLDEFGWREKLSKDELQKTYIIKEEVTE
jgi:hypothetical protein